MMSKALQAAHEVAKEKDSRLRADDPRYGGSVHLTHADGSAFYWANAFVERQGAWFMVFTEHHGFHVFAADEIETLIAGTAVRWA